MAIVLSKEEVLSKLTNAATETKPASSSIISGDTINQFLSNPVVQEFFKRLMDRWLPPVQTQQSNLPLAPAPSVEIKENKIDANKLYLIILGILNSASSSNPNLTVKELKEDFEKNKEEILKLIENVVKSI